MDERQRRSCRRCSHRGSPATGSAHPQHHEQRRDLDEHDSGERRTCRMPADHHDPGRDEGWLRNERTYPRRSRWVISVSTSASGSTDEVSSGATRQRTPGHDQTSARKVNPDAPRAPITLGRPWRVAPVCRHTTKRAAGAPMTTTSMVIRFDFGSRPTSSAKPYATDGTTAVGTDRCEPNTVRMCRFGSRRRRGRRPMLGRRQLFGDGLAGDEDVQPVIGRSGSPSGSAPASARVGGGAATMSSPATDGLVSSREVTAIARDRGHKSALYQLAPRQGGRQ